MSDITTQVHSAISQARTTFNGNKEILPANEQQLRTMALDLQAKIKELSDAQLTITEFLSHHAAKKPVYS